MSKRRRSPLRVLLAIVLGLAGLLILLIVLMAAFVRSSAFDEQVKTRVLPRVSSELGREVSLQSVRATIFPTLAIRAEGLRIAGSTERPLLHAATTSARIAIWPFLFSGGKRIEVESIESRDVEVNLIRRRDGKLDLPSMPREPITRTIELPKASLRNGTLRLIDPAKNREVVVTDIGGEARMAGRVVEVRELEGKSFGGTLRLGGSRIDLSRPTPRWSIHGKADGIDLATLPTHPLDGRFDSEVEMEGSGRAKEVIERSLTGVADLGLRNADWRRLNLEAAILSSIVDQLRVAGLLANPPKNLPTGTQLGDVRQTLRVEDGWMTLQKPLEVRTTFGTATLSGRVALDQRVDMKAQTSLPPSLIAELSGGKLKIDEPIPVDVSIGGTISNPSVSNVGTEALASILLREGIRRLPKEIPVPPIPIPKF